MPRSHEENRRLFDRWAATYDADVHLPSGPLDGHDLSLAAAAAAALLPLTPDAAVLDVGIGRGAFASRRPACPCSSPL